VEVIPRRGGDTIVIEVRDSGVGFASTTQGGGVGLANLRGRLRALYGERASVSIGENSPAGTVVALHIPA
jgi:LytS/YehU family sensor histidine kinase